MKYNPVPDPGRGAGLPARAGRHCCAQWRATRRGTEPALRALVGDAWGAVDVIVVFARASQSASEHNPAPGLQ
eukprot:3380527-Pleurochrysis_carterae.AAC.1